MKDLHRICRIPGRKTLSKGPLPQIIGVSFVSCESNPASLN